MPMVSSLKMNLKKERVKEMVGGGVYACRLYKALMPL